MGLRFKDERAFQSWLAKNDISQFKEELMPSIKNKENKSIPKYYSIEKYVLFGILAILGIISIIVLLKY